MKIIQGNLQLLKHNLKQDTPTRWNSTYFMLEAISEQKMALAAYATEYGDIQQLSPNQLDLIGKVVKVLYERYFVPKLHILIQYIIKYLYIYNYIHASKCVMIQSLCDYIAPIIITVVHTLYIMMHTL